MTLPLARPYLALVALVFLKIAQVGCGNEPSETYYPGCTDLEKERLEKAAAYLMRTLESPSFATCLSNAFVIESKGFDVETILGMIQFGIETQIRCVPKGGCPADGAAAGCVSSVPVEPSSEHPERFRIESDDIESGDDALLANVMIHELLHNHGFGHATSYPEVQVGYDFSVPVQFGTCVSEGRARGGNRTVAGAVEVVLNPVGVRKQGATHLRECKTSVVGLRWVGASRIEDLQFICEGGDDTHWIGKAIESKQETLTEVRCLENESVVSVELSGSDEFSGVAIECLNNTGEVGIHASHWVEAGVLQHKRRQRACPFRMEMVGASLSVESSVEQVSFICEDRLTSSFTREVGPLVGTETGISDLGICSSKGIVRTLFAQEEGNALFNFGAFCEATGQTRAGGTEYLDQEGDSSMPLTITSGIHRGLSASLMKSTVCGLQSGVVGLRYGLNTNGMPSAIAPICAKLSTWQREGSPSYNAPALGAISELSFETLCEKGRFLVGIQSFTEEGAGPSAGRLNGLRPICRYYS